MENQLRASEMNMSLYAHKLVLLFLWFFKVFNDISHDNDSLKAFRQKLTDNFFMKIYWFTNCFKHELTNNIFANIDFFTNKLRKSIDGQIFQGNWLTIFFEEVHYLNKFSQVFWNFFALVSISFQKKYQLTRKFLKEIEINW